LNKYEKGTSLYDFCIKENLPWLLKQFDFELNAPLTPKDVSKSSNKRLYFKYECGHSCKQRIADKTGKRSKGCPSCLNRGQVGRSLLSEYPDYAEMFASELNGTTPDQVSRHNGKSFFWKCPRCNSLFEGKVSDVVKDKRVCGECSNKIRSYPEYCLAYYLLQADPERQIDYRLDGYKFDFYLPEFNLLIEYDGFPWHNTESAVRNDVKKDKIAERNGKAIFRIRDKRMTVNPNLTAKLWLIDYDDGLTFLKHLDKKIKELTDIDINLPEINIKKDVKSIKKFKFEYDRQKSLLSCIPDLKDYLAKDDRNGNPERVCVSSKKIRFWLCDPEHKDLKWSMTAQHLFKNKSPYTQKIKMCLRIIDKYPELKEQIVKYGDDIKSESIFELTCECGNEFQKNYRQLMTRGKTVMCEDCLLKYRISNIRKYQNKIQQKSPFLLQSASD